MSAKDLFNEKVLEKYAKCSAFIDMFDENKVISASITDNTLNCSAEVVLDKYIDVDIFMFKCEDYSLTIYKQKHGDDITEKGMLENKEVMYNMICQCLDEISEVLEEELNCEA